MATRNSYGERLRQARLRRGMDLPSVARRLRIRQDILAAIEDGAFAALPPSGYTRNMITAYARLVGLDPRSVADAYLDELHRFETGRERERAGARGPQRRSREAITRPIPSRPVRDSAPAAPSGYDAQGRRGERVSYNAYAELNRHRTPAPEPAPTRSRRGGAGHGAASYAPTGSSRRRDQQPSRAIGQYSPATYGSVGGRASGGLLAALLPRLPLILGAVLVVALVIAVIALAFGGARQEAAPDVPSVPISGLTDTSSQSQDDFNVATAVAPTSAVLEVSVEEGGRSWVSVYVDGSDNAEVSETMEGPTERSFTFTQSIKVVAGNPTPVKVTVDGKPVELTKTSSGSYAYSVQFSEILAQWREDHPSSSSSSRSASGSSSASASSSSSSSSSASSRSSAASSSSASSSA